MSEKRWAGAAFCNSPAPSSLPIPSFVDTILPFNNNAQPPQYSSGLSQSMLITNTSVKQTTENNTKNSTNKKSRSLSVPNSLKVNKDKYNNNNKSQQFEYSNNNYNNGNNSNRKQRQYNEQSNQQHGQYHSNSNGNSPVFKSRTSPDQQQRRTKNRSFNNEDSPVKKQQYVPKNNANINRNNNVNSVPNSNNSQNISNSSVYSSFSTGINDAPMTGDPPSLQQLSNELKMMLNIGMKT